MMIWFKLYILWLKSKIQQAYLLRLRPQPARVGGPLQQEGGQAPERRPQMRRGSEARMSLKVKGSDTVNFG